MEAKPKRSLKEMSLSKQDEKEEPVSRNDSRLKRGRSMIVYVDKIHCPAWWAVAYGWGLNWPGRVHLVLRRPEPMRRIQEALKGEGLPIAASVENWQVLAVGVDSRGTSSLRK